MIVKIIVGGLVVSFLRHSVFALRHVAEQSFKSFI